MSAKDYETEQPKTKKKSKPKQTSDDKLKETRPKKDKKTLGSETKDKEDVDEELTEMEPLDDDEVEFKVVKKGKPPDTKKAEKSKKPALDGKKEPSKRKPKEKPAKDKAKPTKPKKSLTARKLPLTGKARKLPIEEVDDSVDIDWSFEGGAEEDKVLQDFEMTQLMEKMQYIEREKMNLANELYHMKPDLDQKTKLITELKDDYERLRKDFDKYRKRVRDEVKEKQNRATEKLISELLEILDNFERTNKLDINTAGKEDILKGVQIIHNQMVDVLQKEGLKTISATGEPFDPYIHEAVTTTHTDDHPNNTVLEELQKGYMFKNKVLRASKVRVSQSDIRPAIPIKRKEEVEKEKKAKKKEPEKKEKEKKTKPSGEKGKLKKSEKLRKAKGIKREEVEKTREGLKKKKMRAKGLKKKHKIK